MTYLERNSRLIGEINENLTIRRDKQIGESKRIKFFSVGAYNSGEINTQVYVGLKESQEEDRVLGGEQLRYRFIFELAVMSVIAENMPHLLPELPLFYGLLLARDGTPAAIITEDFSKNGQNYIDRHTVEPSGIRNLFAEDILEDDSVCNIGFIVWPKTDRTSRDGKRRLGDFYPLLRFGKKLGFNKENVYSSSEQQIENELAKHSLQTTHSL